jgi:hypothetical protein
MMLIMCSSKTISSYEDLFNGVIRAAQVVNHGISEETLETVKKTARAFFDLPDDERLKYVVKPGSHAGLYSKKACNVLVEEENMLSEEHVDHFYHYFGPAHLKAIDKWPRHPSTYRYASIASFLHSSPVSSSLVYSRSLLAFEVGISFLLNPLS